MSTWEGAWVPSQLDVAGGGHMLGSSTPTVSCPVSFLTLDTLSHRTYLCGDLGLYFLSSTLDFQTVVPQGASSEVPEWGRVPFFLWSGQGLETWDGCGLQTALCSIELPSPGF